MDTSRSISLDNYFVDREKTPKDEKGDYDYESLYALDLEFFNKQLQDLLHGKEVELPRFNFTTGRREFKGAKLVRVAGQSAQLMAKEGKYAHVRLPSGEMRLILAKCRATIGVVGNADHENVKLGKAGKTRHLGIRPSVRGSVMNPVDHPHGGGEGRAPVGHSGPMTPWGKPALGYKTRDSKKKTNKFIVKRRK